MEASTKLRRFLKHPDAHPRINRSGWNRSQRISLIVREFFCAGVDWEIFSFKIPYYSANLLMVGVLTEGGMVRRYSLWIVIHSSSEALSHASDKLVS